MEDLLPSRYPQRPDDPLDYSDPEQEKRRQSESAMRAARLRDVESAILGTPEGREWLWGLLASLHVHEMRIAVTGSDYENGIWAGEYSAGNRLMRRFASVDAANFSRMFLENDHA